MIFNQLITEEPKYQATALIVATDTINSGGSCSGNYLLFLMDLECINCACFVELSNQFFDNPHRHKLIFCQPEMENWVLSKVTG